MIDQNKTNITNQKNIEEDEIDLIALAKTLWEGRKTVIKTTIIFMGIGLFVALFSQKEYTSTSIMLPQVSDGQSLGGNLGGLAAMAGINLGDMMGEVGISPELYPKIIESLPFQKELLQTKLTIEDQEQQISYYDYYLNVYSPSLIGSLKKYTFGLPGIIRRSIKYYFAKPPTDFSKGKFLTINEDEKDLIEGLVKNITINFDKQSEYVTVTAIMPEALAAAEMANRANELLQKYIIDFKIQKSLEQLKFIEERYNEKKADFLKIQEELALFRDRNKNVNTATAQMMLESLQSKYDLAFSVYSGLAKQLEAYQIEVKKDTPVFTIIDPVSVPNEKSAPKRFLILFMWTFLGICMGAGLIVGREYVKKVKEKF